MCLSLLKMLLLSLSDLCQHVETLSLQSCLHPSKCRCLAKSYSVLVRHVLALTVPVFSSSSASSKALLQCKLPVLLMVLLRILRETNRFIQDCTYPEGKQWSWISRSARKQHEWLIKKALSIALSSEILDVHLHDLLWWISTLNWVLAFYGGGLDVGSQSDAVHAWLKETWASADEEDDVKSMQELFKKIGAKGRKQKICNLVCHRLSESKSSANVNLTNAVVPTYMWMDPQAFENMTEHVLGSNESVVVFETRLMGGRFACKHFHRPGCEKMFAREAVVQASLRHANVLHLLCCTKRTSAGETQCLVMELMHQDLGYLMAKRRSAGMGPFSLLVGVDLILQIAKGMEYLHDMGIMHRDLKSFNILVSQSQRLSDLGKRDLDERDGMTAKIADFGASKAKHDNMYTTKRVGTSIWRAPEVLDDEDEAKYTNKADVYSFAIVCSEILTGLPPDELLPSCNQRSELPKLLKEGRRPDLPASCPPAISSYIKKCWHRDASERPTFREICTVFRFFKACILLQETEMLASPLQDDMFDFGKQQKISAERRLEGKSYHPVLDVTSEVHVFSAIREQNISKWKELPHVSWI